MRVTTTYCTACDREVAFIITDDAPDDAQANVTDREVACLTVGPQCTGPSCPLGNVEPDVMVHRLIRHGLATDQLVRVRGACEACGLDTELALVGENRASCLVCGTTRPWATAL